MKKINQVLLFFTEMFMLFAFASFAIEMPWPLIYRIIFAVALISLVGWIWSIWGAPKSPKQLKIPYLLFFRAFLFILAAFCFFYINQNISGITLLVLMVFTQVTCYFTEK